MDNKKMIIIFLILCEASKGVIGIINVRDPSCENFTESNKPQLHWQQNAGAALHLEIYYSKDICNFSTLKPNQPVKNPSCIFQDAPLDEDGILKVEFVNISSWKSEPYSKSQRTNVYPKFDIQKALFLVLAEEEGTVQCQITSRNFKESIVATKNIRNKKGKPTVFLTIEFYPSFCAIDNCSFRTLRQASDNVTKILQTNKTKLIIDPMQINRTSGGGLRVTFRTRAPAGRGGGSAEERRLGAWLRARAEAAGLKVSALRLGSHCPPSSFRSTPSSSSTSPLSLSSSSVPSSSSSSPSASPPLSSSSSSIWPSSLSPTSLSSSSPSPSSSVASSSFPSTSTSSYSSSSSDPSSSSSSISSLPSSPSSLSSSSSSSLSSSTSPSSLSPSSALPSSFPSSSSSSPSSPSPHPPPGVDPPPANSRCVRDARSGAHWLPDHKDSDDHGHGASPHAQPQETAIYSHLLQVLAEQTKSNRSKVGSDELQVIETILNNTSIAPSSDIDTRTKKYISQHDVLNIAQVLRRIKDPERLNIRTTEAVTSILNKLLQFDEQDNDIDLREMQEKEGTSNSLLQSLDHILGVAPLKTNQELVVKERIAVLALTTEGRNSSKLPRGFGIRRNQENNFDIQSVVEIPQNMSLQWISQEFSAAALLPPSLLTSMQNHPHRLVMTLFWNATLFGGTRSDQYTTGHILGVSVDGHHMELQEPILLLFDRTKESSPKTKTEKRICSFWNFEAENGEGEWSSAGCTLADYPNDSTDICICTHLTHFGKLLYNAGNIEFERNMNQETFVLDLVTVIGCSLSLLGLAGVFLSAIMFPGEGPGRWIQLQLCAAQAVLMGAMLWDAITNPFSEAPSLCFTRGVLLHWSVLALGVWTLTAAIFQHRRLTKPLHALQTDPSFLPLSTVLSWGSPSLVCASVLIVDKHAYEPYTCYPSGTTLLFSVVIPLGSIVITNSIIFLLIVWSIWDCNPRSVALRDSQDRKSRAIRRIIASTYLFCLLGLSWLFGFLHLQFLFCLTASLQGISHFIFCVILDRTTRRSWRLYKKRSQLRFSSMKSWSRISSLSSSKTRKLTLFETERNRI